VFYVVCVQRLDFDEFDQIEEDEDFTLRALKHAGATHITARIDGGSRKGSSRKVGIREGISRSTSVAQSQPGTPH
jgi:hypothetical protein